MSKYTLIEYTPEWFDKWNKFVEDSNNGTLFHRLDFLKYHDDKFKGYENHLIWLKGDALFAVMPLAIFEKEGIKIAKSPYGASYGGLVYNTDISFIEMEQICDSLVDYLVNKNVKELYVTTVPSIYYKRETNYFEFFLFKNGAKIVNSDLTAYIPITDDPFKTFSYSAIKSTKKADRTKVEVYESNDVHTFYEILIENRKKFNALPTHNQNEIEYLLKSLPKDIFLFLAQVNNINIAGTLIFRCSNKVLLDFYWAHLSIYQDYRPINAIVYHVIKWAYDKKFEIFDFGTQTANMIPNYGGTNFKESFGSVGIFRDSYYLTFKIF